MEEVGQRISGAVLPDLVIRPHGHLTHEELLKCNHRRSHPYSRCVVSIFSYHHHLQQSYYHLAAASYSLQQGGFVSQENTHHRQIHLALLHLEMLCFPAIRTEIETLGQQGYLICSTGQLQRRWSDNY